MMRLLNRIQRLAPVIVIAAILLEIVLSGALALSYHFLAGVELWLAMILGVATSFAAQFVVFLFIKNRAKKHLESVCEEFYQEVL